MPDLVCRRNVGSAALPLMDDPQDNLISVYLYSNREVLSTGIFFLWWLKILLQFHEAQYLPYVRSNVIQKEHLALIGVQA